jgi:hypothetical protein
MEIITREENIDLNIRNYNNILCSDSSKIIEFYKKFDDIINEKEQSVTIRIGEKKISSKDFILINLMDIQEIIDSIKYKKSSILYEYINFKLENIAPDYQIDINNYLEQTFMKIMKDLPFESNISFDESISKVFSNLANFHPIINVEDINEKINMMLNELVANKLDKIFIIFVNSEYFQLSNENLHNTYIFDISKKNSILNYNLIFMSDFQNFYMENLLNLIMINWPIQYDSLEVEIALDEYFKNYLDVNNIITENQNIAIISKILNKTYSFNKKITLINPNKNVIVQSFLDSF